MSNLAKICVDYNDTLMMYCNDTSGYNDSDHKKDHVYVRI